MLAIVIPYYKKAFFKATLESLANQTNKDFKVYIGNDASPEEPDDLIKEYSTKLNIHYRSYSNNLGKKSLVKHWERCISLSGEEEWITILGDDDIYEPHVVEMFYKNIIDVVLKEIHVIRFSTLKINENSIPISNVYQHPKIENSVEFIFRNTRSSLSEYVFNKEQLIRVGFKNFKLGWFSDILAVLEVSNFNSVYTINEAIVKVRVSNFSISGDKSMDRVKLKAKFEYYYYLLNNKNNSFSDSQIKILKQEFNKCYFNNKKRVDWYFKIIAFYVKQCALKDILDINKRIISLIFVPGKNLK